MTGSAIKVLLVEDNPADILLLQAALDADRLNTFSLTHTERLSKGLALLRREQFNLVLLDLGLPDSQGIDTFEQLRRQASDLPIIVFSGNVDEQAALQAVRAGAQDYLVKSPGGFDMAAQAIRHALERHQAQKALHESEARFSTVFHASPISIAIARLEDGCFMDVNAAWQKATGYTWEEAVGRTPAELNTWVDPAGRERLVNLLREHGTVQDYEFQARQKSGAIADMLLSAELIKVGGEECILTMAINITRRRQTEQELETRARQEAAVADFSQRALISSNLNTLFADAVTLIARTLQVEYCNVFEWLPDENALRLRAAVGWKAGRVEHSSAGAGLDSQAGYTLVSAAPVVVQDLRTETRFSDFLLLNEHNVVSGISVPIHGQARHFGVLGAHTSHSRQFGEKDVHFLTALANVLGVSIERHQAETRIKEQLDELERWQDVMLDREEGALQLKHEVNELLRRLNEPIRYPRAET